MLRIINAILLISLWCTVSHLTAQKPLETNAVDIYNKIEKLNVLGTVLYIAAHPDDENTRLISYFANDRKVRTAYLSLTRGDGGQNLIGTQIWEKLGLIRTNELLQARSVDGGHQFFSRANDFGYSKHPDETLAFWNKDEVMHDIIKVIREFRPDVIVNRFNHRTPGSTHGHHTSSAMLSVEAFDLAGDKSVLADRLADLSAWQPERVFFNTGWWFYGGRDKFAEADKSKLFTADAGVYYAKRGTSNTEIASRSRSMHKSQGFGSTGTRGRSIEYLELIKGSTPTDKEDPLSGLDMSWNRVAGGAPIGKKVDALLSNFNFANPSANIPQLVNMYEAVSELDDDHWRAVKLAEIEEIIVACAGLYIEAASTTPNAVRGQKTDIRLEAINRSDANIVLDKITLSGNEQPLEVNAPLLTNERSNLESSITIAEDVAPSNPYWLNKPGSLGMYHVDDHEKIGMPMPEAAYTATFDITVERLPLTIKRDVIYKRTDPVKGEVYAPFYIVPYASVAFTDPVYIFPDSESKEVTVVIKSFKDNFNGALSIDHPDTWSISPAQQEVNIEKKGEEKRYTFFIKGPEQAESAQLAAKVIMEGGTTLDKSVAEINYDHIPAQVLLNLATAKFARISLKTRGTNIAYLQGAGDAIPKSLRQIGYNVTDIQVSDITTGSLSNYDAVVMGIRAYNTKKELLLKKEALMDYMTNGGTLVVQYNTSRRIKGDDIGPYPMELSRNRVTDETAQVSFIDPKHEVLNHPNKISSEDFDGWVQERGLYFPNKWDDRYAAPLACNDKGEDPQLGGLLVADVGQGHFIYTGYSWFRELPAGVSGAFRLFANMLSIGKNDTAPINNTGSNE